jgi:uridine phosphorylase
MNYPTWSDLNDESIVPPLGTRQVPDIGSVAIMAACEPDLKYIAANYRRPDQTAFFSGTLMTFPGCKTSLSVAGPFIGSPYAVMVLESLIARGARTILFIGWCGAVSSVLGVGDILVPDKALVDEGTSCNYRLLDKACPSSLPHAGLVHQLSEHLEHQALEFKTAPVWTTDAIYRETQKKVAYFRNQGAVAVEMECSALFSVAEYRKVSLAAVLVVSDSVASTEWAPGFRKKRFKQSRKNVCDAVMHLAQTMC